MNTEEQWSGTIDLMAQYTDLKNPGEPATYWDGSFAKGDGS